jgi:elongation factor Ts
MDIAKIKQLREKTGAGIAECREALEQTGNDLPKAETWLMEHGISKAAKKEGRETSQGLVESYVHGGGKIGVLVEINCETDFVARTDDFKKLTHEVAMQISAMDPKDVNELLEQAYIRDPKLKVADLVKATIAKLGENIKIKQFVRLALGE